MSSVQIGPLPPFLWESSSVVEQWIAKKYSVMKTAWSSDFLKAPKDRQILVRHEDWICPLVIQWDEDLDDWLPCDDLISSVIDDSFTAMIDDGGLEWAEIPQ